MSQVTITKAKSPKVMALHATPLTESINMGTTMSKHMTEKRIATLIESEGKDDFELGGLFTLVKINKWYEGYTDLFDYASKKFGMEPRKTRYIMGNYKKLVKEDISWDKVKDIGWTKLMIVAPVIKSDNINDWVECAKENNTDSLKAMVKQAKSVAKTGLSEKPQTSISMTKLAFTVSLSQKNTIRAGLNKAKAEMPTDSDALALETLFTNYLNDSFEIKKDLEDKLLALGWHDTLMLFGKLFPEVEVTATEPKSQGYVAIHQVNNNKAH